MPGQVISYVVSIVHLKRIGEWTSISLLFCFQFSIDVAFFAQSESVFAPQASRPPFHISVPCAQWILPTLQTRLVSFLASYFIPPPFSFFSIIHSDSRHIFSGESPYFLLGTSSQPSFLMNTSLHINLYCSRIIPLHDTIHHPIFNPHVPGLAPYLMPFVRQTFQLP